MKRKKVRIIVISILVILLIIFAVKKLSKDATKAECFNFNPDNGSIAGYNSSCGSDVVIPSYIDNKKVIDIASYAFRNKGIIKLALPSTIENIGIGAFQDNLIEELNLGGNIKSVKQYAFYNNKIVKLNISKKIESIGFMAFNKNMVDDETAFIYMPNGKDFDNTVLIGYAGSSKDVVLPDNIKKLYIYSLSGCNIKTIKLNNGLTMIQSYALSHNKIENVTIPKSVTMIETDVFSDNKIKTIKVEGKKRISDFMLFDKSLKEYVTFVK